MKCFWIFHQWQRWSPPAQRKYIYTADGIPTGGEIIKLVQTRTCEACGKFQIRKVDS